MRTLTCCFAALPFLTATLLPANLLAQGQAATGAAAPLVVADSVPTETGGFVIRHGTDTVAVEQFSRTATVLRGTLAIRSTKSVSQSFEVVLAPDQSVPMVEVTVRENEDSGRVKGRVVQRVRVIFKEDSASVDDISDHGGQTRLFGTERGAVPYLNLSFALLEQAVRRSRAADPSKVPFFSLGGGQTLEAKISPLGGDSLAMAIGSVEFHLRVDGSGRVLGGRIPSQDVVAERTGGTY
jgi:hypothetical protein